jgi:beta propeller repeat protein
VNPSRQRLAALVLLGIAILFGIPILVLGLVLARDKPDYDVQSLMGLEAVVLSPSINRQQSPAIDGTRVVWAEQIAGYWQIMYLELATGQHEQLTHDAYDHIDPSISNDTVIWWYGPRGGATYVQGLDLSTGSFIFESNKLAVRPRVGSSGVTWIQLDNATAIESTLIFADLETQAERIVALGRGVNAAAESDGIIVWHEQRLNDLDIFAYDLLQQTEYPVAVHPGDQAGPDIDDGIVVWADARGRQPNDGDIYALDLATGTESVISARDGNEYDPRISGRNVVWTAFVVDFMGVFGMNLDSRQLIAIAVNDKANGQPDVSGRRIVWTESDRILDPASPSRIMITALE